MCVNSFKMIYSRDEFLGFPLLCLISWAHIQITAAVIKSMCCVPRWGEDILRKRKGERFQKGNQGKLAWGSDLKNTYPFSSTITPVNWGAFLDSLSAIRIYLLTWSFRHVVHHGGRGMGCIDTAEEPSCVNFAWFGAKWCAEAVNWAWSLGFEHLLKVLPRPLKQESSTRWEQC